MARLAFIAACVALLCATASTLPLTGRESVYDYKLSVGRESCTGTQETGLTISTRVIVRPRTDGAYNIQLTDVAIKSATNEDVDADTTAKLRERLDVPFDYDATANTIKVYAPETVRCESVNLKRGLVNLLQVVDESTGQWKKLSQSSSSGRCPEVETHLESGSDDDSETCVRFTSGLNCTATLPHTVVKTRAISLSGSMCGAHPQVRRNLNLKGTRSKPGKPPKLTVVATEHLTLDSSLPEHIFDDIISRAELTLVEVRDNTPVDAPAGEVGTTTTEVDITGHFSMPQDELLKKAQGGFKNLAHCLNKLDTDDHLEEHKLPDQIIGLSHDLRALTKESLETLYNGLEGSDKNSAFFQILGLVGTPATFEAVRDIYLKQTTDAPAKIYSLGEQVAEYFERIDFKTRSLDAKTAKAIKEFWEKLNTQGDKANPRLKHGALLAAAAVLNENCVKRGPLDTNCPTADKVAAKMAEVPDTDETVILKIKTVANMGYPSGVAYLDTILSDKSKCIVVRTQAAWSLVRMAMRNPTVVVPVATKYFYDRKEDHEIRIAAAIAVAKGGALNELSALVQYTVDNAHHGEDHQVVTAVTSMIQALANAKPTPGSKCPKWSANAKVVWETIVERVYDDLGPHDIFDSATYVLQSAQALDGVFVSVVASKEDVLPRSIYVMARDQLQQRAVAVSIFTDGGLYNNLAQLKAMLDNMQGKLKNEKPDVKAQLAAVLSKIQSREVSTKSTLLFSKYIDNVEVHYERFTKPEQILQRVMARSMSSGKFSRSFKSLSELYVKTHTESGLRVSFVTAQGAATSLEIPAVKVGQMGRDGLPLAVRYSYKFVSRTIYSTVVGLPSSRYRYTAGRLSEKSGGIHRNVSLNAQKGKRGEFDLVNLKIKSDPLQGSAEKDIFFRQLSKFAGNVHDIRDYRNLLQSHSRPMESHTHGHEYLGFGITVSHSVNYQRPLPWKGQLARWCTAYQELETETKPYTFKVAITPGSAGANVASVSLTLGKGVKNGHYIPFAALTLDDPADATKKVLRAVIALSVDTNDPNKRVLYINYENKKTNLFFRSRSAMQMPDTDVPIPKLTRTDDWQEAYPKEEILVSGAVKFGASGRTDFDIDADLGDLLNGLDDPDATSRGIFYRTDEQKELFAARANQVEGDAAQVAGADADPYAKLIATARQHPKTNLKAWDQLLKFRGFRYTVTINRPLPAEAIMFRRKLRYYMVKKFFLNLRFDVNDKTTDKEFKASSNSSVDDMRTDVRQTDKFGTVSFIGIKSKILSLIRPSSTAVKTYQCESLNQPICAVVADAERSLVETFDGRDLTGEEFGEGCEYLVAGNCRGKKTFAITYNKGTNSYTILFDNEYKIVVSATGFEVNGAAQPDKQGLVGKFGDVILLQYKGILAAKLPNKVTLYREKNSSIGYVQVSRIHRGRLCGLCGDLDGDCSNDAVDFDSTATCAARR